MYRLAKAGVNIRRMRRAVKARASSAKKRDKRRAPPDLLLAAFFYWINPRQTPCMPL
jgi:hypothetical protein